MVALALAFLHRQIVSSSCPSSLPNDSATRCSGTFRLLCYLKQKTKKKNKARNVDYLNTSMCSAAFLSRCIFLKIV